MNKKVSLGATLALIILTMALTVSVTMIVAMRYFNTNLNALSEKQKMFDSIADVNTAVRQQVENIDEARLRANLAKGYIASIDDPYAAYLTPAEYTAAQSVEKGVVTGFGIDVALSSNGQIVTSLIHKGSAAERAGMQKGDVITSVDGEAVTKDGLSALEEKLQTVTKVMVTYTRGSDSQSVELTASPYSIESVQERVIDGIGYLRIRGFHENTTEQFKAAYTALEQQNVKAVVFDLRNNEGGVLQSAQDILSYLVPRGKYAVRTDNSGTVTELTAEDTYRMTIPSVTLVNGKTAGEAELFAGVMQELQLTTVIGETTAGQGKIQEYFVLKIDKSAVRLSVGELSLPKGGTWQEKGIVPTREILSSEEERLHFELLDETTDSQLKTALAYLESGNTTPVQTSGTNSGTTGTSAAAGITGTNTAGGTGTTSAGTTSAS